MAQPAEAATPAARGVALLAADEPLAALDWLRHAVADGDASPSTRLNLALAEQKAGDPEAALTMIDAVAQDCPGWDEPPLRRAEFMRARGDTDAAVAAYRATLALRPDRSEALLSLGILLLGQGEAAAALPSLRRCCLVDPRSWQAWDTLGATLRAAGEHEDACDACAEAHALAPAQIGVGLRLAEAAGSAGRAAEWLARFADEAAADPLNATPLAAQAMLLAESDQIDVALDLLEAAAALAPDDAVLAEMHADSLLKAGRNAQAVPAMRHALDLNPDHDRMRNNYAAALTRTFRYAESRAELESILERQGERADPFLICNLVTTVSCLGEQSRAVELARRAVALAPESNFVHRALASAQCYAEDADGAAMLQTLREAGAIAPRGRVPPFAELRPSDPGRRLRVGLLSADLRSHPVGFLTLAGLENLDPSAFELVAVSERLGVDPMQRRFHSVCAEWHVIAERPAEQVRALDLDILIDLGGYGDRGLMVHCAERLAPVQVKWVGMQNHSTGLPEMDWFVSDRWETPAGHEHLYSERLLLMPDGYVCYTPPPDAPDVAPLPALTRGHVTFGCYNNYAKITPRVIETWCAILHAVPGSRFILKALQLNHPDTQAHAMARFAAHGIAPPLVDIRGGSGHRALLAQYADVDLVLDPFPYSGGLTTCEALWMGVPVLTMPGTTFASRHSTSHLSNVGLADWVVPDLDAYRAEAIRRAGDVDALAALRAGLRPRMKASPLCDGPRFGRHLGQALRRVWRGHCAAATAATVAA